MGVVHEHPGNKEVQLNFWKVWCTEPLMYRIHGKVDGGVQSQKW
jgi:hypothetical protein